MGLMVEFMRGVLSLKKPWIVWVMLLMAANFVAPLFFLGSAEARVVLAAFVIGACMQMAILRARGFVRLMGSGHFLWLAMLPWLATRLAAAPEGGGSGPGSPRCWCSTGFRC